MRLRARATENKPILLSIGYSACHWCHVMAHESFEDPDVAAVMNDAFVNIKVDREERPDLDQIYQTAHALLTRRSGGWPLTMFLTPDGEPFFGGTYFPKHGRYGLPGVSRAAAEGRERVSPAGRSARRAERASRRGDGGTRARRGSRALAQGRAGPRAGGAQALLRPERRRLRRRAEVPASGRAGVLPARVRIGAAMATR